MSGGAIYSYYSQGAILVYSGLNLSGNKSTQATGTIADNNDFHYEFGNTTTVDTLQDTNDGNLSAGHLSLREALQVIAPGGTINFAPGLKGGTMTLTSELDINKNITIQGFGANQLTIRGNNQFRDFLIEPGANVTISGLTIANGAALSGRGGGIANNGTLTLSNDILKNNHAAHGGNDIFNTGALTLIQDIASNYASVQGGILNYGSLTVNT
jgi:hypothetical protein